LQELMADYAREERGIEVRQVAGGYRMSTKPEHHDVIRAFSKSLKPPVRLSLPALETLAVIAYKQPVTVPEISDIRGVDASAVIGTLLERKLITTAGRKAVVGRPMLYKTSKDFLLRFGLNDVGELPSLEEFEKLAGGELQEELLASHSEDAALADATGVPDENGGAGPMGLAEQPGDAAHDEAGSAGPAHPHDNRTDQAPGDEIAPESNGG
ncbi:MAG TPA: SMC-Scp complex subunit ScpB, partial [Candidatus Angelobacter sp.]